jgi:hypothetical protein
LAAIARSFAAISLLEGLAGAVTERLAQDLAVLGFGGPLVTRAA